MALDSKSTMCFVFFKHQFMVEVVCLQTISSLSIFESLYETLQTREGERNWNWLFRLRLR